MIVLYILGAVLAMLLSYILFLGVCSLLVSPHKEYKQDSPFYRFLLYSATALALKILRIKVHISGVEKVPTDRKLLFISNHRSNFDPIITWHVFKKWKIAFISKESNFNIPFFGRIIRKCCFMAIDRGNPRKALSTIHSAAKLLRRQEVSIGVYPEGTRSKTGTLLPFHNGVFKIAQKADAAIVVMTVVGTEDIHKNTPLRTTNVYLDVLDIIPAERAKEARTETLGAEIRNLIETNLEKRSF